MSFCFGLVRRWCCAGSKDLEETENQDAEENEDDEQGGKHLNVTKLFILSQHQYATSVLFRDFVRYVVFIVFFAVVVIMQRNASYSSEMRSAVYNKFMYAIWRASDTEELLGWADAGNWGDFWDWHTGPFTDSYYIDNYDSLQPAGRLDRQLVQTHIVFVGGVRMVQRRVNNGSCTLINAYSLFDPSCYAQTTWNGIFGSIFHDDFVGTSNTTVYKFEKLSTSLLAWEEGYYQYFPGTGGRDDAAAKMQFLISDRWLDERATSYARTDIIAFNPNLGMFAQVLFSLEITAAGQAKPNIEIRTLRLSEYGTDSDNARLVVEVVFLAIFFSMIFSRIHGAHVLRTAGKKSMRDIFFNGWEIYDWCQMSLVLGLLCVRFYVVFNPEFRSLKFTPWDVTRSDGSRLDLTLSTVINDGYFTMCGIFMGISGIKFYRYLRVNAQLSVLTQTVVELQRALLNFVVLIVLANLLWAAAGLVLFGDQSESFVDLGAAWEFCSLSFLGLLGRSDLFDPLGTDELYNAPIGAYLFYYPFNFVMVFVALNITVSLIMEAYERVLSHVDTIVNNSVISVLSKDLLSKQIQNTVWHFWVRCSALFRTASKKELKMALSVELSVEIAGALRRMFQREQHRVKLDEGETGGCFGMFGGGGVEGVSDQNLLKEISARPELGFYKLYLSVGATVVKEQPDCIVRLSWVRRELANVGKAKGIDYKDLLKWWERMDCVCDDPATLTTAKEQETHEKNEAAVASLEGMCRRAAQVRDDMKVLSRKVSALMDVYLPAHPDPQVVRQGIASGGGGG
mmetsp:Transcript_14294/g.39040  ORF Transcript_14294/g.39040 Transcript_14294/m.39040 type:complete len:793 (-) Transcript_14294:19-2397(-)